MLHEFLIGKRSELIERCKRKVAQSCLRRRAPASPGEEFIMSAIVQTRLSLMSHDAA